RLSSSTGHPNLAKHLPGSPVCVDGGSTSPSIESGCAQAVQDLRHQLAVTELLGRYDRLLQQDPGLPVVTRPKRSLTQLGEHLGTGTAGLLVQPHPQILT